MSTTFILDEQVLSIMLSEEWMDYSFVLAVIAGLLIQDVG